MARFLSPRAGMLAVLAIAAFSRPAGAQDGTRLELRATRVAVAPKLDGILDDEAWSGTPLPLTTWMSYNPMRGERAAQQTSVWVAYDERAIYFAFKCFDTDPGKIRTTISRRDSAWSDDWVGLSLDSSNAGQLAYHMFVNPSGIQMDGINSGTTGEDMSPDWLWQSAGHVGADGYSVEIRLPLESIRFHSGTDVQMGILFWRRISRTGISASWPELPSGKWVFESNTPIVFGELQQRRLFEMIPSATISENQARGEAEDWNNARTKGDLGVSMKYGLTSTVTLEATANPDFSQVESDAFEVEVNNRFPVFFSEKRPFFMEGLGVFNLAGSGGDSNMRTAVHTRQIVDPSAGAKITGSAGRQTFALLSTADTSPAGQTQRVFTIGRDVLNLGQGQYIGLIATDTEYRSEHNRVVGGDVAMKAGRNFSWNGSFLSSFSQSLDLVEKHGVAAQGNYQYSTRRFSFAGQAEHYDRGFQMDTAFFNRVGISRGWEYQDVSFYPDHPRYRWIKRISPFFWITAAKDRVQGGSEAYVLPGLRFSFTRAGSIRIDYGRGHETFAGRRFQTGQASFSGNVQLKRWLSLDGSARTGPSTFYDVDAPFQGDRTATRIGIGLQPSARLNNNISYTFETFTRRSTGENVYQVHIVNLKNIFQFTPRFFVRAIEQFDSSRKRVLADFLASYELSPGTVAHAGYGSLFEKRQTEAIDEYMSTARAFFFKVSYLARF